MMTDDRSPDVGMAKGVASPDFKAEFKAGGGGTIEGHGAIFGNVDAGCDIIEAGAFADSLKSGAKVRMLWQHDPRSPIGVWDDVREDDRGLWVKGRILGDVDQGREATALVRAGAIDGLSIGYCTQEFRETRLDDLWVRVIEKADLWEVSLVTFPMNRLATIDAVKAATMSQRDFEHQLVSETRLSRRVVGALMGGGFKAVQALKGSGLKESGPGETHGETHDQDYSDLLEAAQAASLMTLLSKRRHS